MIAILDYGAGNLKSVLKAFEFLGHEVCITGDINEVRLADKVILPGVGHFGDAMTGLVKSGLDKAVYEAIASKKPFLGICVGLQLLFEGSEETDYIKGLGIFKGNIVKIPDSGLKIPQMGWNSLEFTRDSRLLKGLKENEFVYFVHSYYPEPLIKEDIIATVSYGASLPVAVERDYIFATQFHPEKSGTAGLKILDNFAKL